MHFYITFNTVMSNWVVILSLSVKIWARKRSKQWSTGRQIQFLWDGSGKKKWAFSTRCAYKRMYCLVFNNVSEAMKVTSNEISR